METYQARLALAKAAGWIGYGLHWVAELFEVVDEFIFPEEEHARRNHQHLWAPVVDAGPPDGVDGNKHEDKGGPVVTHQGDDDEGSTWHLRGDPCEKCGTVLTKHDVHTLQAAHLFGVPLDGVTEEMRRVAKDRNFLKLYGTDCLTGTPAVAKEFTQGPPCRWKDLPGPMSNLQMVACRCLECEAELEALERGRREPCIHCEAPELHGDEGKTVEDCKPRFDNVSTDFPSEPRVPEDENARLGGPCRWAMQDLQPKNYVEAFACGCGQCACYAAAVGVPRREDIEAADSEEDGDLGERIRETVREMVLQHKPCDCPWCQVARS